MRVRVSPAALLIKIPLKQEREREQKTISSMLKMLITKENAGLRLDKFLAQEFFSFSRAEFARKTKKGDIQVNNALVKPSHVLKEGDCVNLTFVPAPESKKLVSNASIPLKILYEDAYILVVNKPANLQVHPSKKEKEHTLVNGILAYLPTISDIHDNSADSWLRPGIVHRLDKDTSGVMVIAKQKESLTQLKHLFQKRLMEKTYLALVYGQLKEKQGQIDKAIARSTTYRKQTIANAKTKTITRTAMTEYKVLKEYNHYSLLEVKPKTGRMHQIRVHLASLGHPIVGDKVYTNKKYAKFDFLEPQRQLLHAQKLVFELMGQKHSFEAQLPEDFSQILTQLDQS